MAVNTVTLPGVGSIPKKSMYIGVGVVIFIIGIAWYRSKKSASTAAAASVAAAGSTTTDPATGFPYGSPEDAAALAAQAQYQSPGGAGYGYGGNTPGTTNISQGTGFQSNAQWAQAVEDYLVNTAGTGDSAYMSVVGNAIGKYLTGQALSPDQVNIVEQGIAFEGSPPVAGTNGYPPSFRTSQTGPTPPSGTPTPGPIYGTGPWNLAATIKGPTEVDLQWTRQGPPWDKLYRVNYGPAGNVNAYHVDTSDTSFRVGALKPGSPYIFSVASVAGNSVSPASAEVSVTTPR
jgi:hypothetical protein